MRCRFVKTYPAPAEVSAFESSSYLGSGSRRLHAVLVEPREGVFPSLSATAAPVNRPGRRWP
jgi:hypothetical protein